jgi:predicted kinase
MLIVFRGLPGTGKSHLVRRLVRAHPRILVLSRDAIRAGLIARPSFGAEEKNLVDDMILTMAAFLLDRGRDVVIDGMALSSASRVEQFAHTAESRGVPLLIVECTCSEATALERLRHDHGGHPAGDRGESLYFEVKQRWEPLARQALRVDTAGDAAGPLAAVLEQVAKAQLAGG